MAVPVPGSVVGNIVAEYAATSININRLVIAGLDGFLTPAYTVTVSYEKKEYLVDIDGHKTAIINPAVPGSDLSRGTVFVDTTETASIFAQVMTTGEILGEVVADMADEKIHTDLVARGILT